MIIWERKEKNLRKLVAVINKKTEKRRVFEKKSKSFPLIFY